MTAIGSQTNTKIEVVWLPNDHKNIYVVWLPNNHTNIGGLALKIVVACCTNNLLFVVITTIPNNGYNHYFLGVLTILWLFQNSHYVRSNHYV